MSSIAVAQPLQTFTLKDYLGYSWSDELVHFDFHAKTTATDLALTDAAGQPVPCQVSGLRQKGGKVTGRLWTVVNLPPKGEVTLHLRRGTSPPTSLRLTARGREYVLRNEYMAIRLPRLPGALEPPAALDSLPAPLLAVAGPDGKNWLGQGAWTNAAPPLLVKEATTRVLEEGPVRVTVRYRLTFTDGRFYRADITLGHRQDAALFTDDTDTYAPKAAFRFSFRPGLGANRVFWRNNYYAEPYKGLTAPLVAFDKEQVICEMRPWAFWWLKDRATWAGFFKDGATPFIGIMALRPSRWSPYGWDGFDHVEPPITARASGELDLTLALLAFKPKEVAKPSFGSKEADDVYVQYGYETLSGAAKRPEGLPSVVPLHRELAITVGTTEEHIDLEQMEFLRKAEEARRQKDTRQWNALLRQGRWLAKLRRQVVKYSEFPLDEVKDFGFEVEPTDPDRRHPSLLFTQADIERARRQAKTVPSVKAVVSKSTKYMARLGCDPVAKIQKGPDGWRAFYRENYRGNYLYDHAPIAYVGSNETKYGIILAAGAKGLARQNIEQFLAAPSRPTIGGNAHLGTTNFLRLLLAFDALADSGHLTAAEKEEINAALVLGAYVIDHPDYWNTDRGLCSANPNMTSLMKLPLGLLGLFLDGHPRSAQWLEFAEAELQRELREYIAPGGAWLECPFYQGPSMDGMFLLSQALKNVKGRDYFADPRFKATMDYCGFILTPPDVRYPPKRSDTGPSPMTVPSIGDAMPGHVTPFNGWMAKATAGSDPAFSAIQQFYWKGQTFIHACGGRANAYMAAICDPELPAAPPADRSRSYEGFGNVLRNSWTDPRASYVSHHNGYFFHHYHQDYNAIIYYAKGAPLCMDFGTRGAGVRGDESYLHTTVSFNLAGTAKHVPVTGGPVEANRAAQKLRSLPRFLDYSAGDSYGGGGQRVSRHLLLVKSDDLMGANYVVMRDLTQDAQPQQEFFWNLWCLSTGVERNAGVAHFPGQFGVDLDAHILCPSNPQLEEDHWKWNAYVPIWRHFGEVQYGVHVRKRGSTEDFFTVLYPRAAGQGAAQVRALAAGRAAEVTHMEGTDLLLLSPGKPASVTSRDARLTGEVVFARRYANGNVRLAVVKGIGSAAALHSWELRSDGPTAIEVQTDAIEGESTGDAHDATLVLPPDWRARDFLLDGKPAELNREPRKLTLKLPEGPHTFRIGKAK